MTLIDDFDLGQILGQGGFATVYRARDRSSGEEVALKIIEKASFLSKETNKSYLHDSPDAGLLYKCTEAYHRIENEIQLHSVLYHPHLVTLLEHFEDQQFIYIALELCHHGNLYKYLQNIGGRMEEDHAVDVIRQLLHALSFLHSQNIVHRDIKLSNILISHVSDDVLHIKLCDLGFATRICHPDEEHFTLCGTPHYLSPEVVEQQRHSFPVDIWALGVVFYMLLEGRPPFGQQGVYQQPLSASMQARQVLDMMLQRVSKLPAYERAHCADDVCSLCDIS
jgi:serine/threonine protein kinase